ncbi:hypothetical protein OG897_15870 [Streptomyces sp. NBC_00237]|uniref:hypothetical protein n=1 Tax=Streptomyces sp. NBC_00237 TaxID=2975687 RepID=UPI002254DBAD|nr:hypothetical protein [Streptomyces sp. NBC_00237]MCX5202923.1 hypothetical protein [Streptomyces sp. NBC_00237]
MFPHRDGGFEMEFLVSLAEPGHREPVARRVREQLADNPVTRLPWGTRTDVHASAWIWTLQEDDPELNAIVYRSGGASAVLRDEIRRGLPFGKARGPLHVLDEVRSDRDLRPEELRFADPAGLEAALRAVTTMKAAKKVACRVGREDWGTVVRADRNAPFPGYARWALAIRPDCPDWARAGFDTVPGFTRRMRRAGIFDSPLDLLRHGRWARNALHVLHNGVVHFPSRPEARAPLRQLVREELGANLNSWAWMAYLLPRWTGTVPDLFDAVRRESTGR